QLGLPLESLRDTRASRFQRDLTLLLNDADHLLGAILVQAFTRGDPGKFFVLTEVLLYAHRLEVFEARVERDHRNTRVQRGLDRRGHRVRLGQRQGDSIDLAVDRTLHQVRLIRCLRIIRIPQLDVVLISCGLGTLTDQIPKRITRHLMGDHRDRSARRVGLTSTHTPALLTWLTPRRRTGRDPNHEHARSGNRREPAKPHSFSLLSSATWHASRLDVIRLTPESQYFVLTLG